MPGSPCLAGHPVQRRAFLVDIDWNNGSPYANPIEVAGVSILAGASYEILFLIAGTLLTTLIAMAIAVTIGAGRAAQTVQAVTAGRLCNRNVRCRATGEAQLITLYQYVAGRRRGQLGQTQAEPVSPRPTLSRIAGARREDTDDTKPAAVNRARRSML